LGTHILRENGGPNRRCANITLGSEILCFIILRSPAILQFMKLEELKGIVHCDPEIMGGTPVFVGTRVPLQNLIDSLKGGESIEDFLDGFPAVKREHVIAVIEAGKLTILKSV
jgi:uncharacterized protein (DUF433 family)